MGLHRLSPVELEDFFPILFPGIGKVFLVAEGTDILRFRGKHHTLITVAVSHFPIEGRVKRMKSSYVSSCPGENTYGYPDHISGYMFLFSEKPGGHIGDPTHIHQLSPYILLKVHHQQRADQGVILIKASQISAFLRRDQLSCHIFQKLLWGLGGETCDHISLKLPDFLRSYETYLHVSLLSVFLLLPALLPVCRIYKIGVSGSRRSLEMDMRVFGM